MEQCFLGHLSNKTRILVTHNLDSLKFVDEIYIMNQGKIVAKGRYPEIARLKIFKTIAEKAMKSKAEENFLETENSSNKDIKSKIIKSSDHEVKSTKTQANGKSAKKDGNPESLVLAEDRETGQIKSKIYLSYLQYQGGWKNFFFLQFRKLFCLLFCNLLKL